MWPGALWGGGVERGHPAAIALENLFPPESNSRVRQTLPHVTEYTWRQWSTCSGVHGARKTHRNTHIFPLYRKNRQRMRQRMRHLHRDSSFLGELMVTIAQQAVSVQLLFCFDLFCLWHVCLSHVQKRVGENRVRVFVKTVFMLAVSPGTKLCQYDPSNSVSFQTGFVTAGFIWCDCVQGLHQKLGLIFVKQLPAPFLFKCSILVWWSITSSGKSSCSFMRKKCHYINLKNGFPFKMSHIKYSIIRWHNFSQKINLQILHIYCLVSCQSSWLVKSTLIHMFPECVSAVTPAAFPTLVMR